MHLNEEFCRVDMSVLERDLQRRLLLPVNHPRLPQINPFPPEHRLATATVLGQHASSLTIPQSQFWGKTGDNDSHTDLEHPRPLRRWVRTKLDYATFVQLQHSLEELKNEVEVRLVHDVDGFH